MEALTTDLKIEVISKMRYVDILELQFVSKEFCKLCDDNSLWNGLINRDFCMFNDLRARREYQRWFRFYDKHTKNIISSFVLSRVRYDRIPKICEEIFYLLVKYVNKINLKNKIITKQIPMAVCKHQNLMTAEDLQQEYDTIHKIFKVVNVKNR